MAVRKTDLLTLKFQAVRWQGGLGGCAVLIDQTALPEAYKTKRISNPKQMWDAIKRLVVRGAPAIGVAAAYGVVLGVRSARNERDFLERLESTCAYLSSSRPTAVNLFWALRRMREFGHKQLERRIPMERLKRAMLSEAHAVLREDIAMCSAIGRHGGGLIKSGMTVLTHCNAGALATGGAGTALSILYWAKRAGKRFCVYADETRPLLQGARLTVWELKRQGVDVTLLCDNMAGWAMAQGKIDLVITGADRIAANGDTANKIGTYSVAQLAKAHRIPFCVAAPYSTFDLSRKHGGQIPIEERAGEEITAGFGRRTAPVGTKTYNPAFDVTPHRLIAGIITERGILRPPYGTTIRAFGHKAGLQ